MFLKSLIWAHKWLSTYMESLGEMCKFSWVKNQMSHDSAMKQICESPGFYSRSRHTRVIPGSFQLKNTDATTKKHNQWASTPTGIVYPTYKQLTVCHDDHITITHSTHNSTGELLHPNIIMVALPVCLNQIVTGSLSTLGENACTREGTIFSRVQAFWPIDGLISRFIITATFSKIW